MSKVILEDTDGGIRMWITDTPNEDGEFVDYDAGVFNQHGVPHDQVLDQAQSRRG